ncbi:MAG: hypothetical protein AB1349_00480 [Elusimicrobiota bacterium]
MYLKGAFNSWTDVTMAKDSNAERWHYCFQNANQTNSEFIFSGDNNSYGPGNKYGDNDVPTNGGWADINGGNNLSNGGTIVANKPHIISFSTDGSGTDNTRYWITEITKMALAGQGFTQPAITWIGSDNVNDMIQDTVNPHIWYKTVRLTAGAQIQFKFYPNDTEYDPNSAASGDNNGWSFGDNDGTVGPDINIDTDYTAVPIGTSANLTYTPTETGTYQFRVTFGAGNITIRIYRADVVINELMWPGDTDAAANEWIELRNLTANNIFIYGWGLSKLSGGSEALCWPPASVSYPGGYSIAGNGYYLIADKDATNSKLAIEPDAIAGTVSDDNGTFELVNTALQIKLYGETWGANSCLIDIADDGSGAPLAGDNTNPPRKSMERITGVSADPTIRNGTSASEWVTSSSSGTAYNWDNNTDQNWGTPKLPNSPAAATLPLINAYHIPDSFEPDPPAEAMRTGKSSGYKQSSARTPAHAIYVCDTVTLYLAEILAGATGLAEVKVRKSADSWTTVNMSYETVVGTTDYYKGTFSTATVGGAVKNNTIQYYFKLSGIAGYSDTYIYQGGSSRDKLDAESSPFSYTIANAPPTEPSNPTPADDIPEVSLDTTYSWNASNDPDTGESVTGYRFEFSSTSFSTPIVAENIVGNSHSAIAGLTTKTTYYWRVFAYSDDVEGSTSTWSNTLNEVLHSGYWMFNSYEPLTYLYRYGPERPAYKRTIFKTGEPDNDWVYFVDDYQKNDNNDNDASYRIYNNHCVKLQAKTKRLAGSPAGNTEIRFYYNIHGYYPNSNVDAGTDDPYLTGTFVAQDGDYDKHEIIIPEDIGTAGESDYNWSASTTGCEIGIRIVGRDKNTSIWSAEPNSIFYFITRWPVTLKEGTTYFGERPEDVLWRPLKHIPKLVSQEESARLIEDPQSDCCYFQPDMPGEITPRVQMDTYTVDANGFLSKTSDDKPDCIYGENPNIFLRVGYGDAEIGSAKSSVVYSTNSTTAWTKEYNLERVMVGFDLNDGFDYKSSNYWGGGRGTLDPATTDYFWSHYNFLRTSDNSIFAKVSNQGLPEGSVVNYYFNPVDGSDGNQYVFLSATPPQVTDVEATAQGSPFSYNILQDDRSRPYIKWTDGDGISGTYPELRPQNPRVTELSFLSPATVTADIYDDKDGYYALPAEKENFSNTLSVGENSGLFSGSASDIGAADSLVHDTRVYYLIKDYLEPGATTNADSYINDEAEIPNNVALGQAPEYDRNDTNSDGKGYVQFQTLAAGSGGECSAQIPLRPSDVNKHLYYRIFVCNNDSDPQYKCTPSRNYITELNENDDIATKRNNHGAIPSTWTDPYSDTAKNSDKDHGWAMYTRYAGQISGPKMIRVTATAQIGKTPKSIITYINAEGGTVGNIIATEIKKGVE